MQYEIMYNPSYSVARVQLDQGEAIMAESGAMVSMSPSIKLDAQMAGGGLLGAIKSKIGGESVFRTTFTAESGPGEVVLAPSSTGDVLAIELNGKMFVQGGSYLAGSTALEVGIEGSAKAMFSGEGLFLLTVSGTGVLFVSSFGAIHRITLQPGEEYIVDTSHMVAFDSTVTYKIEKATGKSEGVGGFIKGMVKSALSGEGLVCRYTGPGDVYIQTRSFQNFVQMLMPFLPTKSN
ncbi:MAG: TIGR00266 family protein [Candidatus Hydrogenedentes bacterium]|nr:TIGR00266 family protein [Candidatus Hydrogenedentota bacterium]